MGQFQQVSPGASAKGGGSGKGGSNPATSGQPQMGMPNMATQVNSTPLNNTQSPPAPAPVASPSPTQGKGGVSNLQSQPGFGSAPAFDSGSSSTPLAQSDYFSKLAVGKPSDQVVQAPVTAQQNTPMNMDANGKPFQLDNNQMLPTTNQQVAASSMNSMLGAAPPKSLPSQVNSTFGSGLDVAKQAMANLSNSPFGNLQNVQQPSSGKGGGALPTPSPIAPSQSTMNPSLKRRFGRMEA